jgi:hypothetical protein
VKRGTDDKAPGSWLRRRRIEAEPQDVPPLQFESPTSAPSEEPDIGWDPYDVWLRRVYLPRQRRSLA